jgi:TRAP transporter TAXI family solute receptor
LLTAALAAGSFMMAACLSPAPALAAEKLVALGTAGVTGVYYPAGGAICRLVNRGRKEHGIRCVVESTGGSIDNLDSLRDGELDMGVVQSDWLYHAYKGTEIFADEGPNSKLRVLFSLHSEPFTILTRKDSNITSFDQLKGKRVSLGTPGSGMRATMEELMKREGWTEKSFANISDLKATDQGDALCSRKIDAMIYAGGHPNGTVQQVTSLCDVRIVGVTGPEVDAMMQDHPFYSYTIIPGGMYRGNPDDVKTFGVKAVLVATADMDSEVVYQIVKAVFDNLDNFKTLHPVFATLDPQNMVNAVSNIAPLHEGAERYFREKGLLK